MIADQSNTLPEVYCAVHTNRKEVLNLVCLTSGCTRSGLLCRLCCSELHSNHDTVSYAQLAEDIVGCRFDQTLSHTGELGLQTIKQAKG